MARGCNERRRSDLRRPQTHFWLSAGSIMYPMKSRTAGPRRVKVSVTVDPALLEAVDLYVQRHDDLDRSKVMDAALEQWYATRQDEAMAEQFAAQPKRLGPELRGWRTVRRTAAARRLNRNTG